MKEIFEFRIFEEFIDLLSKTNQAHFNGAAYVIKTGKNDPLYKEIELLEKLTRQKFNKPFFGYWNVKRDYNRKEIDSAKLFKFRIKTTFEPTGEECATDFDDTVACPICGSNRQQTGPLRLRKGSIPKKDISKTIGGEVVVSERLKTRFTSEGLKGSSFGIIFLGNTQSKYHQFFLDSPELELNNQTIAGSNPFDLTNTNVGPVEIMIPGGYRVRLNEAIYNCPLGHLIGPKILSEVHVSNCAAINNYDVFLSMQKTRAKVGLLRPEPVYLCRPSFRNMIINQNFTGFEFEIAHVD